MRRTPPGTRASLARRESRPGTWERSLADELVEAPTGDAAAVALDAALADLDATLRSARGWSAAALRLALLGGLLGAATAAIRASLLGAAVAAVLGGAGAAASAFLGRRAAAAEAEQRRRADDLVTLLAGGRAGGTSAERPALDRPRRPR